MTDQGPPKAPLPETLKLFRKKYPGWVLLVATLVVCGAIGFAVYKIYSATLPPDLPQPLPHR